MTTRKITAAAILAVATGAACLANAQTSTPSELEQLKAQLNDLGSIKAALDIADPEERASRLQDLAKKQEEELSAKRAADRASMTPDAKRNVEAQESQVNASKTLETMLALHKSMAETLEQLPLYINNPNWSC